MKYFLIPLLTTFVLTSCNGWFLRASPYNPPTPFRPATQTPRIVSPTPAVAGAGTITPAVLNPTLTASIPITPNTDTPLPSPTDTASPQPTVFVPMPSVSVLVLGCNTSLDLTHGMGEVTNAFVTLTNTGNVDLSNLKATLFALDEGRQHPDKTVEIASLPVSHQISIKLTVDSTYQAETPIQVEVFADGGLFQWVGQDSCRDIGLFAPNPASLNTPVPVNP